MFYFLIYFFVVQVVLTFIIVGKILYALWLILLYPFSLFVSLKKNFTKAECNVLQKFKQP